MKTLNIIMETANELGMLLQFSKTESTFLLSLNSTVQLVQKIVSLIIPVMAVTYFKYQFSLITIFRTSCTI